MAVAQYGGNGVPQFMSDYFDTRMRTTEPAETLAWLQRHYGRVDVQAEQGSFAEHASGDCAFVLSSLLWGCRARISYEADRFVFLSSTPGWAWRIGAAKGEYSVEPGVVQPGHELSGDVDGSAVQLVAFDPAHLTETARAIYGDDDLSVRFDGTGPVSPRMRDYWLATVRWSLTQLPLLFEPLVRAHVHRALASATLEAFPLAGDPRERRASALEQAAIYATATSWMDDHASLPITAADAARAAGTSASGLRRAFAANGSLARTPEDYLSQARISAAHSELVAFDPTLSTVGEVALRWGFVDLPSFAAAYRSAYGADPQTTLER
ncbi:MULTISPECIES: helix-turn-helix transcriptional regulator [Microbacterium]|jgi:AraC-like DNA-binding protein|uniref:helix-turn-helix transcriptional regulator n=1 Tax=Microbacterium TaxID=33882 RepID=UPI001D175A73|nr:helix-turn-helix domain-containing protein [Microbacterium testaceum]MCC4250322.1 helix-turn-helix domain-containing protein [Microbacterium testaceum]